MDLELEIINRECNEILFTLEELQNSIDLIESLLNNKINCLINNRNDKINCLINNRNNNKIKVNSQKKNICLNISKKLGTNFDINITKKPKKKTKKKRNRIVRSVIVIDTSDESNSD